MKDGQPQRSDERLFMQFFAFGGCPDPKPLADALARADIAGVLYEDVNDPRGVGLLTFDRDPGYFVDRVRPLVNSGPFAAARRAISSGVSMPGISVAPGA